MKKLLVKDTKKYGKGVFATLDIKKGEIVYELKGVPMDVSTLVGNIINGRQHIDNPLQIGKRIHLKLDPFSNTFNHSCDPNCGLRKKTELFALRDIQKGEEITYDYSLTVAPTLWKMNCRCGSAICRKIIGDIFSVPYKRLKQYKEQGAIQEYMLRLLKKAQTRNNYKLPIYEIKAINRLASKNQ